MRENPDRPQQQRAVETRAALLDAALECLVQRGYASTTTPDIARRAGVSRGAQLHHFPTKAELLAAAVERLLERRVDEFRKAFADLPPGTDRVEAAIDVLWSMFDGPAFTAWAELWMAARTDPALAAVVVELDHRFAQETRAIYAELFGPEPGADPSVGELGRDFAFALMDGMGLQRLVAGSAHRPPQEYLAVLKHLAATFLASAPPPDPEVT